VPNVRCFTPASHTHRHCAAHAEALRLQLVTSWFRHKQCLSLDCILGAHERTNVNGNWDRSGRKGSWPAEVTIILVFVPGRMEENNANFSHSSNLLPSPELERLIKCEL
jgi:hypothetical protein